MISLDKNLTITQLNNDSNYYYNIVYYKYWKNSHIHPIILLLLSSPREWYDRHLKIYVSCSMYVCMYMWYPLIVISAQGLSL